MYGAIFGAGIDFGLEKFGEKCYNIRKIFGEKMKYIYQNADWHSFRWCGEKIQKLLLEIRKAQGYLLGKMDLLGFDVKNNAPILVKVLFANIIMGLSMVICQHFGIYVLINIAVCIIVYFAALKLMKINILRLLR